VRQLEVLVVLVLDAPDDPDQPLGLSLRLLVEGGPVRHVDGERARVILQLVAHSVCLPGCLAVYLSVCLSVCLPACLSTCLAGDDFLVLQR